jgi:hypothetical protein
MARWQGAFAPNHYVSRLTYYGFVSQSGPNCQLCLLATQTMPEVFMEIGTETLTVTAAKKQKV